MLRLGFALILVSGSACTLLAQQCSSYSFNFYNYQYATDGQQHTGTQPSYHEVTEGISGSCIYGPQSGTNLCTVLCQSSNNPYTADLGSVSLPYKHVINKAVQSGSAGSNGPAVTCGGQTAAGVVSCLVGNPYCAITVSINGSYAGLGGGVSFSTTPLWNRTLTYGETCGTLSSVPTAQCQPTGSAPYLPPDVGAEYVWDYATCSWVEEPCSEAGCSSPIVIDTDGTGFHMTSAAQGVMFDFYGNGAPIQVAWTAKGSRNGWLALPKDGKVTSARDLFGNLTPQVLMKAHAANGFAALSIFDDPAYGGNNDGVIDAQDAVWTKLRVWIDENHDGVSQPEELHTLDELGIQRIKLAYTESQFIDPYGNQFRYKGSLIPMKDDDVDRKIFDVFLVTK